LTAGGYFGLAQEHPCKADGIHFSQQGRLDCSYVQAKASNEGPVSSQRGSRHLRLQAAWREVRRPTQAATDAI